MGAGDSFLAGAVAALAAGRNPREAAELGNLVAGVTVQKLFATGTASPEEILELAEHANYRYHPDLAASPHRARFHDNSQIEIVNELPRDHIITRAIFDNDGTVGGSDSSPPFLSEYVAGTDSGIGSDMNCDGGVGSEDFSLLFLSNFTYGFPGPSGLSCAGITTPCP